MLTLESSSNQVSFGQATPTSPTPSSKSFQQSPPSDRTGRHPTLSLPLFFVRRSKPPDDDDDDAVGVTFVRNVVLTTTTSKASTLAPLSSFSCVVLSKEPWGTTLSSSTEQRVRGARALLSFRSALACLRTSVNTSISNPKSHSRTSVHARAMRAQIHMHACTCFARRGAVDVRVVSAVGWVGGWWWFVGVVGVVVVVVRRNCFRSPKKFGWLVGWWASAPLIEKTSPYMPPGLAVW